MATTTNLDWDDPGEQVGQAGADPGESFVLRVRGYRALAASHALQPPPPQGGDRGERDAGLDARNLRAVYGLRHLVAHTR